MLVSPLFVYLFSSPNLFKSFSIWDVMGLRANGLFSASTLPLLLTIILFLGPLSVQLTNGIWKIYSGLFEIRFQASNHFESFFVTILEPTFWFNYCSDLLWIRNHIVAPLSEEFTFRACMLPLLLQSFTPMISIFITPLFFGVGKFIIIF